MGWIYLGGGEVLKKHLRTKTISIWWQLSRKTYICDTSIFIAKEYVCVKAICLFVFSTMGVLMSCDCDHNYLCSQTLLYRPFYGRLASQPPPHTLLSPPLPSTPNIATKSIWLITGCCRGGRWWSLWQWWSMKMDNSHQDFKSSVPGDEFALHGEGIYCKEDHELVER